MFSRYTKRSISHCAVKMQEKELKSMEQILIKTKACTQTVAAVSYPNHELM